jgi:hypothetical protein
LTVDGCEARIDREPLRRERVSVVKAREPRVR